MVNRVFHRKLRRDIARQWSQFAAVMLVVAIASAVYVGASDAYTNLRDSFDRAYVDLRLPDVVVSGDKALKVPDGLPGEPIMSARYSVDLAIRVQGHALMGRLVSLPDGTQPEVGRLAVLSGNLPRHGEAMVERHLADYFGLLAGQSVELLAANGPVEVKVSGAGLASEYFWPARSSQELMTTPEQFGVLFVSESVIAAVAPNVVSQGAWYVRDRAQVDAVTAALRSAAEADGLTVLTRAEQPSFVALDQDVKTFGDFAVMLPMAFLIAGALGAYILLSRLAHSQRAVIGTLTANGIRARTLRRHYLGYGVVAGLGGAIPGVAGGYALGVWFTTMYTNAIGLPLHVTSFHLASVLTAIAMSVITTMLAAWGPARAAARLTPGEAMRVTPPGHGGSRCSNGSCPSREGCPHGGEWCYGTCRGTAGEVCPP